MQDQISKIFKKNYPNLGSIKSVKPLDHRNINSINCVVNTSKNHYVFRNFTDGSSSKKIEKMCQILNFCITRKVKV